MTFSRDQRFMRRLRRLYTLPMRRLRPQSPQGDARRNCPQGLAAVTLLACLAGVPAIALETDTEQPIRITTDDALRDEKTGRTVYQGNVVMVQGTIRITADRITQYRDETGADRIIAEGSPARMQQRPEPDSPLMHAHGDIIEYFRNEERVQLRENAQVEKGDGSMVTGDKIDYFINQELVKAAADESRPNSRVTVIIPPQTQEEDE